MNMRRQMCEITLKQWKKVCSSEKCLVSKQLVWLSGKVDLTSLGNWSIKLLDTPTAQASSVLTDDGGY